ncbi:hypothetical protein BST61_g1730 [Cercospora zeina]
MSSSSSDSDATSLVTALTTPSSANDSPQPIKDPALDYGHLVKDPVAFGAAKEIAEKSTLAELYRFEGDFEHGALLKELSLLSTPVPAWVCILGSDWNAAPVHIPTSYVQSGCNIYVRLVDGLTAPAVRVEARLTKRVGYIRKVIHTAILDFHFNDCNGKQLSDFSSHACRFFHPVHGERCDL